MADWVSAIAASISVLIALIALVHSIRVGNKNARLAEQISVMQAKIEIQSFATGGGGGGGSGGGRGGDGGSISIGENHL
jgi:uncharacterized membrane protein